MKFHSITVKLLGLIIIGFVITTISVLVVADNQLTRIIDRSQNAMYSEKVDVIWEQLKRTEGRLQKTGLVIAYADDFKASAIAELRNAYYKQSEQTIYPFIIDADGRVVMHPHLPRGDEVVRTYAGFEKLLLSDTGEFTSAHQDEAEWVMFKRFSDWGWVVCYTVPLNVKYSDAKMLRNTLAVVMSVITLLVLVVLSVILTQFTKPIVRLTEASTHIAEGNLDQEVYLGGNDEVGILAQSFSHMRDAIRKQITELNNEVNERSKAEAAMEVFQSAVAASTDAIGISTADGNHTYQNEAFDRMFGDIGNDPPASVYIDEAVGREVFQTIMAGKPWVGEVQMHGANDRILDVLLRAYAVRNVEGQVVNLIGVHTDITESKRAEQALEKRLVALTQPLEGDETIDFHDLFNLDDVQQLQDEFAEATGVASIITDINGIPITKPSNFSRLCNDIIRKTKKGRENCCKSDTLLGQFNPHGPTIQPCMSEGLWDAGSAITVGGRHIANWLIGQVRDATQDEDSIRAYAREIGANEAAAVEAFLEVTSMSQERFGHVSQALFTLAQQLSTTAYQNVQQARFISDRNKAEKELRRNEEDIRTTLDSIGDAVIATDTEGMIVRMNPVARKLTGWEEEATGRALADVFNVVMENTEQKLDPVQQVLAVGEMSSGTDEQIVLITKSGSRSPIALSGSLIRTDQEETLGVVLVFRDITEDIAIQEHLRHSQKMDAIGQLAGGVAHDFNNVLGGILGCAEILKERLGDDQKNTTMLDMIIEASVRAGGLTQKLLAFARKQPSRSSVVDIHSTLRDTISFLQNTIDRRIELETVYLAPNAMVQADASQLQSAFLNLGINASHAMPDGGMIHVETQLIDLDDSYCNASPFELKPGDYIDIEIRDTGCGIPAEELPRIFEPFFTTKEQGKGTGLGLSAVYGTVQQHYGGITVQSELGKGTTFHVFLPVIHVEIKDQNPLLNATPGSGRILVVDDEELMRESACAVLEHLGYETLEAADGQQALAVFEKNAGTVDLVLLDMIMPVMNGRDCFEALKKIQPDVKVILSSGFAKDDDVVAMENSGLAGIVNKPYKGAELCNSVSDALSSDARETSSGSP